MDEKILQELVDKYLRGKKCKWDDTTVEDLFRIVATHRLDRIERMLKWLVAEMIHTDKDVVDEMRLKAACNQPDITDILEGG